MHRVLPVPGRLPRAARPPQARGVHRPALPRLRRGARDAPARHRGPRCAELQEGARHRLLQHHQVLHEGLPGAHHDHRQRDHPAQGAGGRPVLRSAARGCFRVLRRQPAEGPRRAPMFELKPLSPRGHPRARSRRPSATGCSTSRREAESICLDVLARRARRTSRRSSRCSWRSPTSSTTAAASASTQAREVAAAARATSTSAPTTPASSASGAPRPSCAQGGPASGTSAYDWFREAMDCYEKAEALAPAGQRRRDPALEHLRAHPGAAPAPDRGAAGPKPSRRWSDPPPAEPRRLTRGWRQQDRRRCTMGWEASR